MLSRMRNRFGGFRGGRARAKMIAAVPPQVLAPEWAWVPGPDFAWQLAAYAQRNWVSTAIDRIAEMCVAQPLEVRSADGMQVRDHPLLRLLGHYGRANPYQDSREFLEAHFQRMDVYGNDVWLWVSRRGGPPDSVYQLELSRLKMFSDAAGTRYEYWNGGRREELDARAVTHFRRASVLPSGIFWGLSSLEKLRDLVLQDSSMAKWNREFFQNGAPSGVLLVDPGLTSEADAVRLQAELETRALKGSTDDGDTRDAGHGGMGGYRLSSSRH